MSHNHNNMYQEEYFPNTCLNLTVELQHYQNENFVSTALPLQYDTFGKRKKCRIIEVSGASTVKWTCLDPCSGLSESDLKSYINFEFYEIKIHKHLESI